MDKKNLSELLVDVCDELNKSCELFKKEKIEKLGYKNNHKYINRLANHKYKEYKEYKE